jgi:hypothetical protein
MMAFASRLATEERIELQSQQAAVQAHKSEQICAEAQAGLAAALTVRSPHYLVWLPFILYLWLPFMVYLFELCVSNGMYGYNMLYRFLDGTAWNCF